MEPHISGIHHITAIASDPQENVNFYAALLGLRLVKVTVNFDDPGTYHLYYGDEQGRPGSILTFFPWPGAPRGRRGTGQVTAIAFAVPEPSLEFWATRLRGAGINAAGPVSRFDEQVISFQDPDGQQLELVAHSAPDRRPPWQQGPVPPEHAIRGFYAATISIAGYEQTDALLTRTMGFRHVGEYGSVFRYQAGEGGPGALIDVVSLPEAPRGEVAAGTVHHIAWRTPDDPQQAAWRERLIRAGQNVTPIQDRQYFHSIYYREPGGVLFEIATDSPGFTTDESLEQLGTQLKLPPWLEEHRQPIERALPPLRLPLTEQQRGA